MNKRIPVRTVFAIGCAVLAVAAAAWMTVCLDAQMLAQERVLLLDQVRNAAIGCYASEGRYPQELDYLVEHYGLIYDGERYSIQYDAFASNIMPDIAVHIRGEDD